MLKAYPIHSEKARHPMEAIPWREELDIQETLLVPCKDIETAPWVTLKCQYGCKDYGKRYSCPPSPPPHWISGRFLSEYKTALLVHDKASWKIRWAVTEIEKRAVENGYSRAFGMGSGPCQLCAECPEETSCPKPQQARPSMEAMGIDVFGTVKKFGYSLQYNPEKPKFFGLVLIE